MLQSPSFNLPNKNPVCVSHLCFKIRRVPENIMSAFNKQKRTTGRGW